MTELLHNSDVGSPALARGPGDTADLSGLGLEQLDDLMGEFYMEQRLHSAYVTEA